MQDRLHAYGQAESRNEGIFAYQLREMERIALFEYMVNELIFR